MKIRKGLAALAVAGLGLVGLNPSSGPVNTEIKTKCGVGSIYFPGSEMDFLEQARKIAESSSTLNEDAFLMYNKVATDVGGSEMVGGVITDRELVREINPKTYYTNIHLHQLFASGKARLHSPLSFADFSATSYRRKKYCNGKVGAVDPRGFWYILDYIPELVPNSKKNYNRLVRKFIGRQYEDNFNFEVEHKEFIKDAESMGFYMDYIDLYGKIPKGKVLSKPKTNFKVRQVKK